MADQLLAGIPPVLDNNGDIVAGGSVTFYETGTTTLVDIFSDIAGTVPLTNPLTLDSAGRPAQQIFYVGSVAVKEVIKDAGGATLYTVDPSPRFSVTSAAASGITYSPIASNPNTDVQAAIDFVSVAASVFPTIVGNAGKAPFVNGGATAIEYINSLGYLCTATGTNTIALATGLDLNTITNGVAAGWLQDVTNTGAATVSIDNVVAAPLVLNDGSAVAAGKLVAGDYYSATYDGTNWVLDNATGIDGTVIGATTPVAGTFSSLTATTADINAGTIDGTTIGATTPAAGSFTTVDATGLISSNVLRVAAGGASAPSVSFTSDTNSGFFSGGADRIDVSLGGASRGFFSTAGYNGALNGVLGGTTPAAGTFTSADVDGIAPYFRLNETDTGAVSQLLVSSSITKLQAGAAAGGASGAITFEGLSGAQLTAMTAKIDGGEYNVLHSNSTLAGINGVSAQCTGNNVDNTGIGGMYYGYGGTHVSATAGTNPFPTLNGAFNLIVQQAGIGSTGEYVTQIATALTTGVPEVLYRTKTTSGAGWSAWDDLVNDTVDINGGTIDGTVIGATTPVSGTFTTLTSTNGLVYAKGNILGITGQTAGVPTGSVIQQGSNANGTFVRFADGTQICTVSAISSSAGASSSWTYPAVFLYPASPDRPALSGAVATTFGNAWRLIFGGISSGVSVSFDAVNTSNARVVGNCSLIAIGRWF